MPARGILLGALVASVAAAASTAGATAAPLPTFGAPDGVAATSAGQRITLRLTGAAAAAGARYAGRRMGVRCAATPPPGLALAGGAGLVDDEPYDADGEAKLTRGADGALTLSATFDDSGSLDVCELQRPQVARRPVHRGPFLLSRILRAPLARVALTPAGATWIDELAGAIAIQSALDRARHVRPSAVLTAQEATAAGLAVLPDEGASPPPGRLGYWTDGGEKVEVVALSAAGRRLLEETLGGGLRRSNTDPYGTAAAAARDAPVLFFDTAYADRDRTATPLETPMEGTSGIPPTLPATVRGRRLTVRFEGRRARATLRRLAGRRLSVACGPAAEPENPVDVEDVVDVFQLVTVRVPRRGATALHATLRAGRVADVCAVADDTEMVGTALPTAAGRAFAQDLNALGDVLGVPLADPGAKAYPPAARLAADRPKELVALATPDAAPPAPGRAGVWTDATHARIVARSRSGHDVLVADEGDGILRDNVGWLLIGAMLLS